MQAANQIPHQILTAAANQMTPLMKKMKIWIESVWRGELLDRRLWVRGRLRRESWKKSTQRRIRKWSNYSIQLNFSCLSRWNESKHWLKKKQWWETWWISSLALVLDLLAAIWFVPIQYRSDYVMHIVTGSRYGCHTWVFILYVLWLCLLWFKAQKRIQLTWW